MARNTPRHVPLRRCVACRRSRPQGELLRFYQTDGVWRFDAARQAGGRGSWLCADSESCWALKKLQRTFRAQAGEVRALLETLKPPADAPLPPLPTPSAEAPTTMN